MVSRRVSKNLDRCRSSVVFTEGRGSCICQDRNIATLQVFLNKVYPTDLKRVAKRKRDGEFMLGPPFLS